jgi:hypothetical protein
MLIGVPRCPSDPPIDAITLLVRLGVGIIHVAPILMKTLIGKAGLCAAFVFVQVLLTQVRAGFVPLMEHVHVSNMVKVHVVENHLIVCILFAPFDTTLRHGRDLLAADSIMALLVFGRNRPRSQRITRDPLRTRRVPLTISWSFRELV